MAELRKVRMVNTDATNDNVIFVTETVANSPITKRKGWVREDAPQEVTFKSNPIPPKAEISSVKIVSESPLETELQTEEKAEKPVVKRTRGKNKPKK